MPASVAHVVRAGDCVESVAAAFGCAWRDLWEHPANAALRARRPNPNLLAPGDVIQVPASLLPSPQPVRPGGTHHFRGAPPLTTLRLRLMRGADTGDAVANVPFRLRCDATTVEGTTAGDGSIEARVPATARRATLRLAPGTDDERVVELEIGHLDPIEERSGVAQRLQNLGLLPAEHGDDEVQGALSALGARERLEGDAAIVARLRELHDG